MTKSECRSQRAPSLTELPPQAPAAWCPWSVAYHNCRSCLCRTRPSSGHHSHHLDSGCKKDPSGYSRPLQQRCPALRQHPQRSLPHALGKTSAVTCCSSLWSLHNPHSWTRTGSPRSLGPLLLQTGTRRAEHHRLPAVSPLCSRRPQALSVALTSGEPTAPASAPSEEAPAPSGATSIPTGSVVR